MKKTFISGLTLIELLISMALIAIILSALVSFFSQNSQASVQLGMRSDLQQDTLNAQQLITGRLREAFYVMPPGQTLVLSSASTKNVPTYTNPVTGPRYNKTTWLTGTDPILAMVLPPADGTSGQNCTLTTSSTSSAGNDACYRFYAYYPVNRKVWTDGTTASNDPGTDTTNANAWVLVQYMGYLSGDFVTAEAANISSSIPEVVDYINTSTAAAQILSDYVEPTINDSSTAGLTNTATTYSMFTYANSNGNTITATNPVDTVTINLASARLISNKLMRLPDATNEYTITVNLTNQGKIAASN